MAHLILMTASEIDTVIKPNPQKKNPISRLTGIYSRKSWISKINYLILELLKPPKTERKGGPIPRHSFAHMYIAHTPNWLVLEKMRYHQGILPKSCSLPFLKLAKVEGNIALPITP